MKISINPAQVTAHVDEAWKKALPLITYEVLRDCNEFAKLRTGALRASAHSSSLINEGIIRWNTPYARRQYWKIPTAYEPGTQWQWCEGAKAKYSQRWADQANAYMGMSL